MKQEKTVTGAVVALGVALALAAVTTGTLASVIALQASDRGADVGKTDNKPPQQGASRLLTVGVGLVDGCLLTEEVYCLNGAGRID